MGSDQVRLAVFGEPTAGRILCGAGFIWWAWLGVLVVFEEEEAVVGWGGVWCGSGYSWQVVRVGDATVVRGCSGGERGAHLGVLGRAETGSKPVSSIAVSMIDDVSE